MFFKIGFFSNYKNYSENTHEQIHFLKSPPGGPEALIHNYFLKFLLILLVFRFSVNDILEVKLLLLYLN